ncbi:hypothetical protein PF005_g10851 [Phytophthora fragariae]|uniref:Uncharacterized protein n=1 Tax=Phytophthora fragariae TaxID=53985 RepID=A0A6A3ZE69_9STRA|nr:hypothetical protein PF009_g11306 [Phytophthora fragariae]KAE9112672.1 hypothetical protein PF007_g11011 [Phytophthora fragariae]KAE9144886.1 hypothetical protein PF006_g10219 [Phytophthora fragariae]KAE9211828.1 hypothetical protein PF005_g10851 [Phytophthora fragariae]KAE9232759.1 hypothetical protein PF002_g12281 [Phytophthora fragariae]
MSIFGGSERFPNEPARSPGPIYAKPDVRANAQVVMKADYRPVDESRKWGKRESWIGGPSPQMPVVSKESGRAPGHYNDNVTPVKIRAPKMSFPKSDRFLSQKVNMTDMNHQRELMAVESPGPKYNVNYLAANGGKAAPPRYSFAAPPSPKSTARAEAHKTRLPDVDTPRRGHRESWLSVINRNGVLVMPASPVRPRQYSNGATSTPEQARATPPEEAAPSSPSNNASGKNGGNAFGHEQRFGKRQLETAKPNTPAAANTRVLFVSATHTRENMGEFSPGPIYSPYNPECPGGRLAPSPRTGRRPQPPSSPADPKDPHANPSSRSSWLAGAVRKCDGQETVLLSMGDIPPGPGSYAEPPSSFATFSHNAKAKSMRSATMASRPSPRKTGALSARLQRQREASPRKGSAMTRPAEPTEPNNEP